MMRGDLASWKQQNSGLVSKNGGLKTVLSSKHALSQVNDSAIWLQLRTEYLQERWLPTISCPELALVGKPVDGGNQICNYHRLQFLGKRGKRKKRRRRAVTGHLEECLVYSFGTARSNESLGFERSLPANCETHVFDNAAVTKLISPDHPNIIHHNLGIVPFSGQPMPGMRVERLEPWITIMDFLNHSRRSLTILKIDVSWFDIELVQEILESEKQPHPEQLVIRLRMAPPPTLMHVEADSLLQTLRNYDYHMFATKTDFHRPLECAEYSFMKIDRISLL
jgi:hypothetical protein